MEAASTAARAATRFRFPWWESVRAWVGKYGLIVVLLALPVRYVIGDLVTKGSLVSLGNIFVAGISNGAIWALVALGYTLVYGIIELINFAHGDVFMIGSFASYGFFGTVGLTLATGALGSGHKKRAPLAKRRKTPATVKRGKRVKAISR